MFYKLINDCICNHFDWDGTLASDDYRTLLAKQSKPRTRPPDRSASPHLPESHHSVENVDRGTSISTPDPFPLPNRLVVDVDAHALHLPATQHALAQLSRIPSHIHADDDFGCTHHHVRRAHALRYSLKRDHQRLEFQSHVVADPAKRVFSFLIKIWRSRLHITIQTCRKRTAPLPPLPQFLHVPPTLQMLSTFSQRLQAPRVPRCCKIHTHNTSTRPFQTLSRVSPLSTEPKPTPSFARSAEWPFDLFPASRRPHAHCLCPSKTLPQNGCLSG